MVILLSSIMAMPRRRLAINAFRHGIDNAVRRRNVAFGMMMMIFTYFVNILAATSFVAASYARISWPGTGGERPFLVDM